jgi:hypothetical protein
MFEKILKQLGFRISASVEDGICEVKQAIETGMLSNVDEPRYRN